MGYSYVLLPQAQADYEGIVRYLALDLASPAAARRFADEFDVRISDACAYPEMYPLSRMPEVAARGYRVMPVMRYRALYRLVDERALAVAHIFHASQDYARYV